MDDDGWITPPADHPVAGADDGWVMPPENHPIAPHGAWESAGEGALSGLTAGWSDELRAMDDASGMPGNGPERSLVGAAKLAYEHLSGQPGEASKAYDKAVAEYRTRQKEMQEQHPYAYGAGQLGGAGATMLAAPVGAAGTLGARVAQAAKAGAAYGAASGAGEGEGATDKALGAVTGAGVGGLGGAAAVPVGAAASKIFSHAAGMLRGLVNPTDEALRRTTGAILKDAPQIASGQAQGLTPAAFTQAKTAGDPVMLGDLGGANTKALMRSAANTSPEARDVITSAVDQRFRTQAERGGTAIRNLVSGGANAMKTRAQIQAEYDAERGAAYGAAYAAGDRPLRTPVLERLMGSDAVVDAMKAAVTKGKDRAIAEGQGAFRTAAEVTPDGRLVFRKGPNGVPTYPNLQFWDQTYRGLRDTASAAMRAGRNDEGSALTSLSNSLKSELDKAVPEFAKARGVAQTYFGGNDAIEAGQKAVSFKGNVGQMKLAMAKMKPAERELFQESYADAWATKLEGMADNRDITTGTHLGNSINDRKKIDAVFGPQGAAKIQAFSDREKIYDSARKALGNSTTARQLIEAGLAGGVGSGIGSYFDGTQGSIGGFLAGASLHHAPRAMIQAGAQKLIGRVDQRVASKVAQYLTSDDPADLQRGLQLVAGNPRLSRALTALRDRISTAAGAGQLPGRVRLPAGVPQMMPASNPQDQTAQRAKGGRVGNTRAESHYSSSRGKPDRHCGPDKGWPAGYCAHFEKPHACSLVSGKIATRGGCDWYRAVRASGGRAMADGGAPDDIQPEVYLDQPQTIGTHHEPSYEEGEASQEAAEAAAARVKAPYAKANARESGLPQVLDYYGNKITSALTAPRDALTGAMPVTDTEGMPTPEAMQRAQGVANLAMTGGMPMAQEGALGMFGGRPTYSGASEAARNAKLQVGTPGQWLGYLKNQPGVKPAELEHIGLEPWLNSQEGKLTRDQVNQYIESKQPEIQEVTKGGHQAWTQDDSARLDELEQRGYRITDEEEAERQALISRENNATSEEGLNGGTPTITKYSSYQLPGATNYGETLLTLPPSKEVAARRANGIFRTDDKAGEYQSSHWDEPNVLLHVRHNDRTVPGPNGEPMNSLHMEELQSDWHQQGRKVGYRTDKPVSYEDFERQERGRNPNATDAQIREDYVSARDDHGVPDAPFKQTWPDLGLKRMLHRAATERNPDGSYKYDALSWTPGEAQAARYDLSKQISEVRWSKTTNDLEAKDHSGKVVMKQTVPEDKLADTIGKDAADKLANAPTTKTPNKEIHILSGVDLKVGGEGMKKFYDKMLPDKANALVKKFVARVNQAIVNPKDIPRGRVVKQDGPGNLWKIEWENGRFSGGYGSQQVAQDAMYHRISKENNLPVHVIRITPALRAAAEKGFPTFASGGRVHVDRNPTSAQIEAGNYRKGHVSIQGLPITIENPRGSERSGVGKDGKRWAVTMPAHYGYFKGTVGKDKDHVDCYIGPHTMCKKVFIIDQNDADTGKWDEHKCMIGFSSADKACECYIRGFSDGKGEKRIGHITEMSMDSFKHWLREGDTKKPARAA